MFVTSVGKKRKKKVEQTKSIRFYIVGKKFIIDKEKLYLTKRIKRINKKVGEKYRLRRKRRKKKHYLHDYCVYSKKYANRILNRCFPHTEENIKIRFVFVVFFFLRKYTKTYAFIFDLLLFYR